MAIGKHTIPDSKPTGFLKAPAGTVEDARKAMIDSAEAAKTTQMGERVPSFIEQERKKAPNAFSGQGGNTPVRQDFVEEAVIAAQPARVAATPEPVSVSVPPAVVDPATVVIEEEQRDLIETRDFTGEIYRDGADWVAEITYKNGAGDERFTAPSIRELNKKLLEGKGHATIKVRAEVRRRKLGNQLDTFESAVVPVINKVHNLTTEQFFALPASVQDSIVASIQIPEVTAFMQEYPEFYNVESNWDAINQWLQKTNSPATRRNVALAFQDLTEDGLLTARPVVKAVPQVIAPVVTTQAPAVATTVEDSAVVTAAPAAAPATAVRKRGSSGLVPGQSSAAPATVSATTSEEGTTPQELSREQLKGMDVKALRRLAIPSLNRSSDPRR